METKDEVKKVLFLNTKKLRKVVFPEKFDIYNLCEEKLGNMLRNYNLNLFI